MVSITPPAALAVAALFIAIHMEERPSWQVTGLPGMSQLHPGETLQTGAASEAQIKIARSEIFWSARIRQYGCS